MYGKTDLWNVFMINAHCTDVTYNLKGNCRVSECDKQTQE